MEFQLGDIVAFNSHAFYENLTNITISGDSQLLSPLMVIIEKLYIKDENDLQENSASKVCKEYKCIWYSNKNYQFEEGWFAPYLLKKIDSCKHIGATEIKIGDSVLFKSHECELSKIKSSIGYDEINKGYLNKKISSTSLLSHLSPVMIVIQIKKNNRKGQNFNIESSSDIVKCKWYNAKNDKFSEYFLPLISLKLLQKINENVLRQISNIIKEKQFIRIDSKKLKAVIQPKNIIYRSGFYILKGFDFITNDLIEININDSLKFDTIKKLFTKKAPIYNFSKSRRPLENVEKIISVGHKKGAYLRIKYKNLNEKITVRTLKKYKLEQDLNSRKKGFYLTGYCLNKEDIRSFKIERIQEIEVLNINF